MLATLLSSTLVGLDGRIIRVEVDVAPGLPGFTIVGLADAALQEARERVRGAIRNAGFSHPPRRITVNLAPADLRKAGASLDLAIAMGILLGSEQLVAVRGRMHHDSCHRAHVATRGISAATTTRVVFKRGHEGGKCDGRGACAAPPVATNRVRRGLSHRVSGDVAAWSHASGSLVSRVAIRV